MGSQKVPERLQRTSAGSPSIGPRINQNLFESVIIGPRKTRISQEATGGRQEAENRIFRKCWESLPRTPPGLGCLGGLWGLFWALFGTPGGPGDRAHRVGGGPCRPLHIRYSLAANRAHMHMHTRRVDISWVHRANGVWAPGESASPPLF